MTNVLCSAKTCGYNDCNHCCKKNIDIEGLFAKSKIGTFCQSFKNPQNSEVMMKEMAKELNANADENVSVACSANYCAYNDNNYCQAKQIKIGNEEAKYRSETQCDSFKLR